MLVDDLCSFLQKCPSRSLASFKICFCIILWINCRSSLYILDSDPLWSMMCMHTQSSPTLCDPWPVAHQASLPVEFSRQEYWSRLPFPSSEDLPDPGMEPASLVSSALAGEFFTSWATREAPSIWYIPSIWFANMFFHSIRCLFTAFSLSASTPQTPGVAIPESARRGCIIARAEVGENVRIYWLCCC